MFNINDKVIYGSVGLCIVTDFNEMIIDGASRKYYVLTPAVGKGTVYVPVEGCDGKLRNPISKTEAEELVNNIPELEINWVENDMLRKVTYSAIIKKADPKELLTLLKTLYLSSVMKKAQNKKIHVNDDKAMNEAGKIVFQEFGVALDILPEEAKTLIMSKLEGTEQ